MLEPPSRLTDARLLVALSVVLLTVHAQALLGGFVFDDVILLRDSPLMHDLALALRTCLGDFFGQAQGQPEGGYVRPIPHVLNALTFVVSGGSPLAFRVSNLAFHIVNVALVLRLTRHLGGDDTTSRLAAVIFALHPVQVEAVDFISARTDLLATAFALLSLEAVLRRQARPLLAVVYLVLAVGSKESALVVPGLAVIGLWALRTPFGAVRRRVGGLFVVVGLVVCARLVFSPPATPRLFFQSDDLLTAVPTLLGQAVSRVVFPAPGRVYYDDLPVSEFGPLTLLGVVVLGALAVAVALAVRLARRGPVLIGGLLAAASVLPVLHLVPLPVLAADRFLYLPMFGVALSLAAASLAFEARARRATRLVLVTLGAVFVLSTYTRSKDWASEEALWSTELNAAPNNAKAALNLGIAYVEGGRLDEGKAAMLHAWTVNPGDVRVLRNLVSLAEFEGRSLGRSLPAAFVEAARQRPPEVETLRAQVGELRASGFGWLAVVIERWPEADGQLP